MGIFSTLHVGRSGMNAAEVQLATVGHNITNLKSEHYTRQRVIQQTKFGILTGSGQIGQGVEVKNIIRLHDDFTYEKMRVASTNLENTGYLKRFLQEASQRLPDLKDVGILNDLKNYQKAWTNFASNPSDGAMKINLAQHAQTLANTINSTRDDFNKMQILLNDELETTVGEINRLATEIADINRQLFSKESLPDVHANDLRDRRDELELQISKLVSARIYKQGLRQDHSQSTKTMDYENGYYLNVSGMNLVDGIHSHPLKLDAVDSGSTFKDIYFELEDEHRYKLTEKLQGGTLGAQLDLRGRYYNENEQKFTNGLIQEYIDDIDALAGTFIAATNSIYAGAAAVESSSFDLKGLDEGVALLNWDERIKTGTFDLIAYNNEGLEMARKTIHLDPITTMNSNERASSLVEQINSNTDDNDDHNNLNDFDDYFTASFSFDPNTKLGKLSIIPKSNEGYKVAFKDNGTNLPGVLGMGAFFEGKNAADMRLSTRLAGEPELIRASSSGTDSNNDIANAMVQLQYEKLDYKRPGQEEVSLTIDAFYRSIATNIGARAENNNTLHKTNKVLFDNVYAEYKSVSGVNMNEELSDLIVYQHAFSAAAKVITTVDRMMDTLLGIKQ